MLRRTGSDNGNCNGEDKSGVLSVFGECGDWDAKGRENEKM